MSHGEPVARYLVHKSDFSREKNRVKPRAFMPPADLKTSLFRTLGLSEDETWSLGEEFVARPQKLTLRGRGDLLVCDIAGTGLRVEPDEPPERHANIVGWSADKDKQRSVAQELAARASLKLRAE